MPTLAANSCTLAALHEAAPTRIRRATPKRKGWPRVDRRAAQSEAWWTTDPQGTIPMRVAVDTSVLLDVLRPDPRTHSPDQTTFQHVTHELGLAFDPSGGSGPMPRTCWTRSGRRDEPFAHQRPRHLRMASQECGSCRAPQVPPTSRSVPGRGPGSGQLPIPAQRGSRCICPDGSPGRSMSGIEPLGPARTIHPGWPSALRSHDGPT
jgi:hypothetical protein